MCAIWLILKDAHVDSRAADSVRGVIQSHGCSTVLEPRCPGCFSGLFPLVPDRDYVFSVSFVAMLCLSALFAISCSGECMPSALYGVRVHVTRNSGFTPGVRCAYVCRLSSGLSFGISCRGHFHGVFPLRFDLVDCCWHVILRCCSPSTVSYRAYSAQKCRMPTLAASSQTSVKDMDDKSGQPLYSALDRCEPGGLEFVATV